MPYCYSLFVSLAFADLTYFYLILKDSNLIIRLTTGRVKLIARKFITNFSKYIM